MTSQEQSVISLDDLVSKWKGEFLEDDAAIAVARETLLELGFVIEHERVDRETFTGDGVEPQEKTPGSFSIVSWKLIRARGPRPGTQKSRSWVRKALDRLGLKQDEIKTERVKNFDV